MTQPVLDLMPRRSAHGAITLPGSKSLSNRALLLAALARGETRLQGLLDADDTRMMLGALRTLGVAIAQPEPDVAVLSGRARFAQHDADIFLGNAGTALRPLTAVLAVLGGNYRLSGVARMHERPVGDLVDALRSLGACIEYLGQAGYPPLRIGQGSLQARHSDCDAHTVTIRGTVSSQFLTALLIAAPLAVQASGRPLHIAVEGELISKPYILITLNLMARFGVAVEREGWSRFVIPADAAYASPGLVHIEGDASTASYFMALGAIGAGPIRIQGVGRASIQGDVAFADTLIAMGAHIAWEDQALTVTGPQVATGARLRAFDADFNLIPDAAMTAAVLALYADAPCVLRNIGSWRVKETDRIAAMQAELRKLGARVESGADWLRVHPLARSQWRAADIHTYDDHRMAMCFSLAAFGPHPVRIQDPECVRKTFPGYFQAFLNLVH